MNGPEKLKRNGEQKEPDQIHLDTSDDKWARLTVFVGGVKTHVVNVDEEAAAKLGKLLMNWAGWPSDMQIPVEVLDRAASYLPQDTLGHRIKGWIGRLMLWVSDKATDVFTWANAGSRNELEWILSGAVADEDLSDDDANWRHSLIERAERELAAELAAGELLRRRWREEKLADCAAAATGKGAA